MFDMVKDSLLKLFTIPSRVSRFLVSFNKKYFLKKDVETVDERVKKIGLKIICILKS